MISARNLENFHVNGKFVVGNVFGPTSEMEHPPLNIALASNPPSQLAPET